MNLPRANFASRVFPDPFPPPWANAWGDDRYGLWCEIEVGGVAQRLRWIEPGKFWMGSTEAERQRFGGRGDYDWKKQLEREGPRHCVILAFGFWLADTACTQALWLAVVGDTPSYFTGNPQLPVEMVSWVDVTEKFLPELNRQIGSTEALLPSEAQWEYACRAGKETAYHFGEKIDGSIVNCRDDYPQPGNGMHRGRDHTLPVKALPANTWGLYQMHGNVWEWCADAMRHYRSKQVKNPDGGQDGILRGLRGGSWKVGAGSARSAFREDAPRVYRLQYVGFRFALRSIEPGAGGGMGDLDEADGAR